MLRTELLHRLANDREDPRAWEELWPELCPFVFATSFRIARGQREIAEDVSQEVFLRLQQYSPFSRFEGDVDGFKRYVSAMCRNAYHSYLRRLAARGEVSLEILGGLESELWYDAELEQDLEADELLRHLLASLPSSDDRKLLRLVVDGYSLPAIARRMGLRYAAAGVRVHRMRKRLRKELRHLQPPG